MNARVWLWVAALVVAFSQGHAIDLRQRSESSSKQFVVFSSDVRLRQRVASYAEQVKKDVLDLVGESDHWKAPIVLTLERASTMDLGGPPVVLRLVETQPGFKVEITVKIGDDPRAVNLQKHLIRAVLLEYAYREPGVTGGMAFSEAPWWIVEGLVEMERRRDAGADGDLFRRLVETNHLPELGNFLVEKPDELGPTALAIDRALAMCLLQMLVEQPGGHAKIGRLIREWPQSNGDAMGQLAKIFPDVAGNRDTLQKWWTVNLARFSAVDRFQGMTAEDTEKALQALLQFDVPINKQGEKKTFSLGDFAQYLKFPASHDVLEGRHAEIIDLSARTHALYRPVMADYEAIFALLAKGKARGLKERIAKADQYRAFVAKRVGEIADYMNWFEATQMKSISGTFDNYLKSAEDISEEDKKHKGPISEYLDQMEQEY